MPGHHKRNCTCMRKFDESEVFESTGVNNTDTHARDLGCFYVPRCNNMCNARSKQVMYTHPPIQSLQMRETAIRYAPRTPCALCNNASWSQVVCPPNLSCFLTQAFVSLPALRHFSMDGLGGATPLLLIPKPPNRPLAVFSDGLNLPNPRSRSRMIFSAFRLLKYGSGALASCNPLMG